MTVTLPHEAAAAVSTSTINQATYHNPVYPYDFPDPFILRVGDTYYGYATNVGAINIPTIRSTNLVDWQFVGDALPCLPTWAAEHRSLTWAPGALQRGDTYLLYYTARYSEAGLQAVSVATSDGPDGPFVDVSRQPLICQTQRGGSIDPYPFVDDDGRVYLLWKSDDNAHGRCTSVWIQEMSDDAQTLQGEPIELICQDQDWEHPLIENPALWKHEGRYYLFYSANWWESASYCVGYAVSEHITGPYTKPQQQPILKQSGPVLGPGGQAFFSDTAGDLWLAYHAWTAPHASYPDGRRSLHIDPVTFEAGVPVIHGPSQCRQPFNGGRYQLTGRATADGRRAAGAGWSDAEFDAR